MENDETIKFIGVFLRVPGVFILELLYLETLTLNNLFGPQDSFQVSSWNFDILLYIIAWLLILLPIKLLLQFYSSLTAFACVAASHYLLQNFLVKTEVIEINDQYVSPHIAVVNQSWVSHIQNDHTAIETSCTLILSQLTLSLIPCKILNCKPTSIPLALWPMIPWLACNFTCDVLVVLLKASVCISLAVLVGYLVQIAAVLHNHMKQLLFKSNTIVALFGWQGVVEWARGEYQIQNLLITCWCLRYGVQVYANLHKQLELNMMGSDVFKVLQIDLWDILNKTQYSTILLIAVVQCMNTSINLFGFVCIVKEVIKFQYFLIRSWLHCSFTDHPPDSVSGPLTGAIDGITFLIMSLYTDLLSTELAGRFLLLMYILFTIASSQFQSIFNIIDPILMTLATAHNGTFWKHLRTVILALILLCVSGGLSYISFFSMSSTFWVFIIAYNYVNTFSLMLGSLAIYCVLMVDYHTLRGWQSLDDVMFYIRGACRAVEFAVTLCMCGYIMATFYMEMTSVAGIVMLAIYTYYCIVQRGGKGWKIWMMRRQAAHKVQSLQSADSDDLETKKDLCPICYQLMESDVRIMHCKHHFHENCLKKWFYIQDKCPMCYAQFKTT